MAIVTSQQITRYYDLYRDTEIIFSKDIIRTLNMDPRQIYIKCSGAQWPCIINSTSFQKARIIIGTKGGAFKEITKKDPSPINLRFCFIENNQLLSFFIASKVTSVTPYMNSNELAIVTLTFTQRPPDDLIQMIGHLLDANINFVRRKEERIPINEDTRRKLSIPREETIIVVQKVPRHCILRDLSFGGAKVILLGLAQYLTGKDVVLHITFDEPSERVSIAGKITGAEPVEGRKDIISISIKFDDASVPLAYKLHINEFLSTVRKKMLDNHFSASGDIEDHPATILKKPILKKPEEAEKKSAEGEANTAAAPDASKPEEKPAENAKPSESEEKPAAEGEKAPETAATETKSDSAQ